MKYTVAALFIGAVSAEAPVWSLRSVNEHRADSTIQQMYGDFSTSQANGRDPYESTFIQFPTYKEEVDHSGELFKASQSKQFENGYSRVVTDRFSSDSDDIFMRSMISTYALETKNKDGSPTGTFIMNEAATKAAASEVLATHKGLKGEALEAYLNTYFAKAWGHFDVNKSGSIEVIKMPQFMRFLASDQYMSLGESA